MKKVFLVYLVIVATLSISARAEDIPLNVTASEVDSELQVIKVSGHFSTPCVRLSSVKAELVDSRTISLSFVGQATSDICIQILGSSMALAIDAANIKSELLRNQIDVNGKYKIVSKQANINTEFNFTDILPRALSLDSRTGKIVQLQSGLGLQTQNTIVKLFSPFIDVEAMAGQVVELVGHMDGSDLVGSDVFRNGIKRSQSMFVVTGLHLVAKD